MKKVLSALVAAIIAITGLHAQDIASIKKLLLLVSYNDARADLDKVLANPAFNTNPETWLLKSYVYSLLAAANTAKADSSNQLKEAFDALQKYCRLEPSLKLLLTPEYSDVSRRLYVPYFNSGISKFNAKQWMGAYNDLQNASILSEYLIKSKILPGPIDTSAILYTGVSAQNAKKDDDAATWYGKLANAKVAGADNEFFYQFLADYYMRKRDQDNFNKYQQLGAQLYPQSKYFISVMDDYVRGSDNFNDVVKFNESKVLAAPASYDAHYDLGAEIYDHIYPADTSKTPKTDVSGWEKKMVNAFQKASEIQQAKGIPFAIIGNHYIKKADRVNNSITAVLQAVKNAGNSTTGASKELVIKKEALYKDYYSLLDQAVYYFEKAAERFSKEAKLTLTEKQFYKNAAANLGDIYAMKKTNASKNPAELARFTSEQKKWDDVYTSIK